MALNSSATSASIASVYDNLLQSTISSFNTATFLQTLSTIIDTNFQQATPSLPNIDITTPAGTFNIAESGNMLNTIADACVAYWSNTVSPTGSPVSCSAIASVSNTASSIHPIIISGLLGITGRTVPSEPYYNEFIDVIFNAVKTIQWTVTEADGTPCSATLTATIS